MCLNGFWTWKLQKDVAFKLKIYSQKQKGENGPLCFQVILASVGDLCAMLLGFYMTAAIACSSCAEFVRTALPTNRIVWYQVVVVST